MAGLVKEGTTVNTLAPALTKAKIIAGNPQLPPEDAPVGRFCVMEEVAELKVMLVRNEYITGQAVGINGSLYITRNFQQAIQPPYSRPLAVTGR